METTTKRWTMILVAVLVVYVALFLAHQVAVIQHFAERVVRRGAVRPKARHRLVLRRRAPEVAHAAQGPGEILMRRRRIGRPLDRGLCLARGAPESCPGLSESPCDRGSSATT